MIDMLYHPCIPYVIGGGIVALTTIIIFKKLKAPKRKVWPRDIVILHSMGRGPWVPSFSPFPIKLETYLRMAKIPHITEHKSGMSPKGKTPWITYNDIDISDSQFCIEYLNKTLNVDLNNHLTSEEKAIGRAFQKMVEENLYWVAVMERWVYEPEKARESFGPTLPYWMFKLIKRTMKQYTYAVGMGRHTREEVTSIGHQDLNALSIFLGKKKYFFGDKPCEYDAAIFGFMALYKWQGMEGSTYIIEHCPNLMEYAERMREAFWPDWDDLNTHGHTKKVIEKPWPHTEQSK